MHVKYLKRGLFSLPSAFTSLDASHPWLLYWILHSLTLLGYELTAEEASQVVSTLNLFQDPEGGYGGGIDQISHLATSYAAVLTLVTVGTKEALESINLPKMASFLSRMKQPNGSFTMHQDGEVDIRGSYCALTIAVICNILTPKLVINCASFIAQCQTYEGGFGSVPGTEAHGGYTFCAIAALDLIDSIGSVDVEQLVKCISARHMSMEGGFQGRINKLVDGCYSFWQAGSLAVLSLRSSENQDYLFCRERLQVYVLACCQSVSGGFTDRPGNGPDYYHTCYCLSGLSIAQHSTSHKQSLMDVSLTQLDDTFIKVSEEQVVGKSSLNKLKATHPTVNVCVDKLIRALSQFRGV